MSFGEIIVYLIIAAFVFVLYIFYLAEKENNKNTELKNQSMKNPSDDKINKINDLSDFRISISTYSSGYRGYGDYVENTTKNKSIGRWVDKNEVINIGKHLIKGGMFYTGGKLLSEHGYGHEPSLLDDTLKTYFSSNDNQIEDSWYLESYLNLTAKQRAKYVNWLAGERADPDIGIKYVLLYFCGLERRLIVDSKNDIVSFDEYLLLTEELRRLKDIYVDNSSFKRKVERLLTYSWILFCSETDLQPPEDLLNPQYEFNNLARLMLGKVISSGKTINSELAMIWLNNDSNNYLRTPAHRCKNEFLELFNLKFKEEFANGLFVKPNKTKLTITYSPVNHSIEWKEIKLNLPDVSMLSVPVKKIMKVAENCMVALDSYSRYLGRNNNSSESLSAVVLLPDELSKNIQSKLFKGIKSWLEIQYLSNNGIVSVNDFLLKLGKEAPIKINKKESLFISRVIEKAGYGFAPDVRYHYAKPDRAGKLVLYKNTKHRTTFSLSNEFNIIGTILRLGSMVAVIDNHIHESEVEYLRSIIDKSKSLSEHEKESLHAYLIWRLDAPINMVGLKARIELINNRERSAISNILVNVALADGEIKKSEIHQLQKLYNSLGLDKELVLSDIHKLSSGQGQLHNSNSGFSYDQNEVNQTSFSLNDSLIKSHEEDTIKVKRALESIFVDESVIEEETIESEHIKSNLVFSKLDSNHIMLFKYLISKEEWQRNEVEEKCLELSIMLDGSLELINDWSYECVDAPLIEDGEILFVDLEVVEEIQNLNIGEK